MDVKNIDVKWLESARHSLHVVAACVWVGGQFVLGGLVPMIRRESRDMLPVVARAFARMAWPAYAVLVLTGVWNVWSLNLSTTGTELTIALFIKLVFVAIAGLASAAHSNTNSTIVRAVGGALALVASVAALYLGVVLTLS